MRVSTYTVVEIASEETVLGVPSYSRLIHTLLSRRSKQKSRARTRLYIHNPTITARSMWWDRCPPGGLLASGWSRFRSPHSTSSWTRAEGSQKVRVAVQIPLHNGHRVGLRLIGGGTATVEGVAVRIRSTGLVHHSEAIGCAGIECKNHVGVEHDVWLATPGPIGQGVGARDDIPAVYPSLHLLL